MKTEEITLFWINFFKIDYNQRKDYLCTSFTLLENHNYLKLLIMYYSSAHVQKKYISIRYMIKGSFANSFTIITIFER